MKLIMYLSNFIIPMIIFYVVATGIVRKVNVYEVFLDGVKEGLLIVVKLVPTLIALLVSVGVLRASGIFELLQQWLTRLLRFCMDSNGTIWFLGLGIPLVTIPVFIIRIFSSSAATGLLLDIFKQYGADSLEGLMASISLSCTEAVLYCLSVYFAAVHITKLKWSLRGSLLATFAGVLASILVANWLM